MSNRIVNIGTKFPAFNKLAVVSLEEGKEFEKIDKDIFKISKGKQGGQYQAFIVDKK